MTIEEKAKKYAKKIIVLENRDSFSNEANLRAAEYWAYKAYLAGYIEAMRCQSNLKIKQLEWRGDVTHRIKTNTSIGEYEVYKSINGDYLFYIDGIKATTITFNSLEKAKAFAQKDFEARVKKCLIIE